jgi:hypothetical protein
MNAWLKPAPTLLLGITITVGALGTVWEIHPGESIQQAIDLAQESDALLVHPGAFR